MTPEREGCRRVRELLLDHAMQPGAAVPAAAGLHADWPAPARAHLEGCSACRYYAAGLEAAHALRAVETARPRYYGPTLRHRTLVAVRAARAPALSECAALAALLVAGAAAAVFAGFVLPVWMTTRLLETVIASRWTAFAAAVATCSSLGLAAVGPAVLALVRSRPAGPSGAGPLFDGWR